MQNVIPFSTMIDHLMSKKHQYYKETQHNVLPDDEKSLLKNDIRLSRGSLIAGV